MIKLAKPFIPEIAINEAINVLKSGNLVQGKFVKEFEQKLEQYLRIKNAIIVSNGTAALHLSLIALGIKSGDEVIVPAFTFPATANAVELVGAKPVFVDINPDDFCINTDLIESVITSQTKAIIPVHEFGQSAKMDDVLKLAKKYNLKIIEDAACALGSEFDGKKPEHLEIWGVSVFIPGKLLLPVKVV
jgi:dTDP-4-amino-4,6-dideoxygalactose transaminase